MPHPSVRRILGRERTLVQRLLEIGSPASFRAAMLRQIRPALHARAARGLKIFTGSYVVPAVGNRNKVDSILDLVERVEQLGEALWRPSLRGTWAALTELDGIGSFLGGQITADLAHLTCGSAWLDRLTWAPVGPGSARGMNRVRGRAKDRPLPQAQFDAELADLTARLLPRV